MLATLWRYKWWWMIPLAIIVTVIVFLAVMAMNASNGPAVYPMF
jgi:hypothetical protein